VIVGTLDSMELKCYVLSMSHTLKALQITS